MEKWTLARMFNEDVLMRDGVLSAITIEEICEKLNALEAKQTRIQELEKALHRIAGRGRGVLKKIAQEAIEKQS
jgi:hypothetical protein